MSDHGAPRASMEPVQKKSLGRRREKYTPRACVTCQQRKVKCSGEDTCRNCRTRNVECVYASDKNCPRRAPVRNKRKRASPECDQPDEVVDFSTDPGGRHSEYPATALQERVRKLEETLRCMTAYDPVHIREAYQSVMPPVIGLAEESNRSSRKPAQPVEALPSSPNWPALIEDDSPLAFNMVHTCDGETDTFEALVLKTESLSLSSQLSSLRKNLGLGAMGHETRARRESNAGPFAWELPSPARMQHLLHIYFHDFECYLPFLNQSDMEFRVSRLLDRYEYAESKTTISIGPLHYPLAALVCNIIAVAETMEPGASEQKEIGAGWPRYLQGLKLIQRCSSLEEIDLDLIRYYAVASGYLMHTERLRAATTAISMAIQLACKAKLNDQRAWSNCAQDERMARKKLWWTIYFMDRRIGQKNGTAYLIRDSEVNVDDFLTEPEGDAGSPTSPSRWNPRLSPTLYATNDDSRYLQALVNLGRLWGQIWDQFFAVTAPSRGDSEAVADMDSRILDLQNHLPAQLIWNHPEIEHEDALNERQTRRRLLTLIRMNTLRLIIRQNPLLGDQQDNSTKQFCAELAGSTVRAIAAFHQNFPSTQASGYFVSASLLECICQLVPVLQTPCTQQQRAAAIEDFRQAYRMLAELAKTIGSASRAVKALNEVFSVGEVVSMFKSMVAETEDSERIGALPIPGLLNTTSEMNDDTSKSILSQSIFDTAPVDFDESINQQTSASQDQSTPIESAWGSFCELFADQPSYSFDPSLFLVDGVDGEEANQARSPGSSANPSSSQFAEANLLQTET